MALKRKLTAKEFEKINEALKEHYKKEGDGYELEAEGFDDATELKGALENERKARKEAAAKAKEFETKFAELSTTHEEALKSVVPKQQFDALENSYKKKYEGEITKRDEALKKRTDQVVSILGDGEALKLATKIFTAPSVGLPHIKSRLKAEEVEGQIKIRVLDKDGNPSALTFDDLEKEILANKEFAPILVGSKGSGGGANGSQGAGGAHSGKTVSRQTFDAMSQNERASFIREGGKPTD